MGSAPSHSTTIHDPCHAVLLPPTRLPGAAAHRWAGALHRLERPQPHLVTAATPGQGRSGLCMWGGMSTACRSNAAGRCIAALSCLLEAMPSFHLPKTQLSHRCGRRGWLWRTATCPSATCCGSRAAGGRLAVSWHALLERKERVQDRREDGSKTWRRQGIRHAIALLADLHLLCLAFK